MYIRVRAARAARGAASRRGIRCARCTLRESGALDGAAGRLAAAAAAAAAAACWPKQKGTCMVGYIQSWLQWRVCFRSESVCVCSVFGGGYIAAGRSIQCYLLRVVSGFGFGAGALEQERRGRGTERGWKKRERHTQHAPAGRAGRRGRGSVMKIGRGTGREGGWVGGREGVSQGTLCVGVIGGIYIYVRTQC